MACNDQPLPKKQVTVDNHDSRRKRNKTYCNFDFIKMKPYCECDTGFEFSRTDSTMTFLYMSKNMVFNFNEKLRAYHYQAEFESYEYPIKDTHILYDAYLKNGIILLTERDLVKGHTDQYSLWVYSLKYNKEIHIAPKLINYAENIDYFINDSNFSNINIEGYNYYQINSYKYDSTSNVIKHNFKETNKSIFTYEEKYTQKPSQHSCVRSNEDLHYIMVFQNFFNYMSELKWIKKSQ